MGAFPRGRSRFPGCGRRRRLESPPSGSNVGGSLPVVLGAELQFSIRECTIGEPDAIGQRRMCASRVT